MEKKLYVGNISYQTSENDLQEYFSQAGEVVSVKIIIDRDSNRSKGFGFIEMATEEGAAKAIEMFNQKDFMGRDLVVNEARPMS